MVVTAKTVLLTLLAAFLLFISAITLGLKGTRTDKAGEDRTNG